MIKYVFFLLIPCLLASPVRADAVDVPHNWFTSNTYTHTYQLELKPASLENSYKTASVCFLGEGDCGTGGGFDKSDGLDVDTVNQCKNEGYTVTSCNVPEYLNGQCPYNTSYYSGCVRDTERACTELGFVKSCSDSQTPDTSNVCEYNNSYFKCSCKPCDGYDYTYDQATATGFVPDGTCTSCETTMYKRKENPCVGFMPCECGGEIGTQTCKSGSTTFYKTCKTCCENKCTESSCPEGAVCSYEACSQKYCPTGCDVNYSEWCTTPITDCGTLGYTKSPSECTGPYLKCPYGEGVFCKETCDNVIDVGSILYSDYSVCSNVMKSKTALGIVVFLNASGKHGQAMATKDLGEMEWGEYGIDTSLPNKTTQENAMLDYNSCDNTDKILSQGDANLYPSAWAARNYAPTNETKGKWCLPAAGIMTSVKNNLSAIQAGISKLNGSSFPDCCVWSSSESNNMAVWGYDLKYSYGIAEDYKYSRGYSVRPVIEF